MLLPFIQRAVPKKAIAIACFLFAAKFLVAQNIGIGTPTPNANALLDITATNKGILIPRLTNAQMIAITSPEGLLVYNSDSAAFAYRNATSWVFIKGNSGASNDWSTKGNAGTTPDNHFIGTTDNQDLVFKRNNVRAGLINSNLANTSWGAGALNPVGTGFNNTAMGYNVLFSNTTGNANTSSGYQALYSNTTGNANTGTGGNVLEGNISGTGNSGHGYRALNLNTTGDYNTANGIRALYSNASGYSNVAVGAYSLYNNTDRSNLVAIGDSALYNNGIGASSPVQATFNTAIGSKALYLNTTGYNNTANGFQALYTNTAGTFNTAIGSKALYSNTSGNNNTANGFQALYKNTTGTENTANGSYTLYTNTTGTNNTANGAGALYSNATGSFNTANGYQALYKNIAGVNNTTNGYKADVITDNLTNATAIGANAKVGSSNSLVLGDTTNVNVGIGTGYPTTAKLVIKTAGGEVGIDLASSDAYAEMRVIRNTLSTIDKNLYLGFSALPGSAIKLYSEGMAPTMTVTGQNVGIGTETPSEKLDVNGNVNISGSIINEAWHAPVLNGGWINYGLNLATIGYYKDKEGTVHLKGTIKNGTSDALFLLPPGYRPLEQLCFVIRDGNAPFFLNVYAINGVVSLSPGHGNTEVSLDGVSFRAEQ